MAGLLGDGGWPGMQPFLAELVDLFEQHCRIRETVKTSPVGARAVPHENQRCMIFDAPIATAQPLEGRSEGPRRTRQPAPAWPVLKPAGIVEQPLRTIVLRIDADRHQLHLTSGPPTQLFLHLAHD